jgi:hypothetical protein
MNTESVAGVSEDILRKIKKCLALASSPVAGEAEAAMRQAQKLMAMHGVTDGAMARNEITAKHLQGTRGINPTPWETSLAFMCCRAFGAKLLWSKGPKGGKTNADNGWWTFIAPKSNVELIVYTFTVLSRQVLKARSQFLTDNEWRFEDLTRVKKAAAFCEGFVHRLGKKVGDAMLDPRVKQAMDDWTKEISDRAKAEPNYKPIEVKNNGKGSLRSLIEGADAGDKASFHAATSAVEKRKQLGNG